MSDQPTQPGQRNVANRGDHNTIITGDHNVVTIHQTPPLPPPSPLHQLRAPVGDFVGRANEITTLLAALKHDGESNMAGISGISGMGGIGKTELAYVVAAHLAPQYPDAQLVVDLRGTDAVPRPAAEALAECVRAFAGLEARLPDDEAALVRLYRECLTGRRALVVLDNAAADEQVRPFLPPPGSALLVTSRATLHLPGLRARIQLNELVPAEARALLQAMTSLERVPDAVADQICSLCGYLPLAVRAAGGLLDVTPDLDAATYAAELRDTRARLALRYANAEGRNLSVEASFQLSYQRLPDEAARVFRALAVFPADFDGAAVEAIAADAGRSQLRELLRRNLVRYRTEEQRYRLHDLARVFADAQASEAERAAWQAGHARYFCAQLARAKELYLNAQVIAGLALYDRERANIAAGQAWAEQRAASDDAAARVCMNYANAGAYLIQLRLHPREQIRWLEAQLAAARHLRERWYEGVALGNLGNAYAGLGEPRRAIKFYKRRLVIAREIGDRLGEGNAIGNLGVAYMTLGEPRRAIEFYEQQLVIVREMGDQRGEGNALGNLGNAYADLGEPRRAIKFYEQHLVIAREIGDRFGEGAALWNKALAWEELSDRTQAIVCAEAALPILETIESPLAERVRKRLAEWRQ